MFSGEAIFSWVGSKVTRTGQPPARTSCPVATDSLWIRPSGEAA
jgi:hypothetical protein